MTGERKCMVCRCTDEYGCAEGCGWITMLPPVCSSCLPRFVIARLWGALFGLESAARGSKARDVAALRRF